jgi:hypothetical protein
LWTRVKRAHGSGDRETPAGDDGEAKQRGLYSDGGGLYLRVATGGRKNWTFRFMRDGRARAMRLGPVHTLGLAEARECAACCRKLLLSGVNPIKSWKATRAQAKLDAAKAMTFEQCAERYIGSHKAGWKNRKHAAQWPNTLGAYVYPVFGSLPVQAIDVGLVMKAIEPIWTAKPEPASRVRG